jgi:hypothetical protein
VHGVAKSHWHVLVYDDSAWDDDDGNDDNDELKVLVAMMLMMVLMMMMTLDGHKLVYLYYSFVVDAPFPSNALRTMNLRNVNGMAVDRTRHELATYKAVN